MTATPPYRTKLIEVGLPLEAINAASAHDKSLRHGHPSTLHFYWAPRPLPACCAVIFASLVDDPISDPAFKDADEQVIRARRSELHDLLIQLVNWKNRGNVTIINRAKSEIASSVASLYVERGQLIKSDWPGIVERKANSELVDKFVAEIVPPILDPFAGGGRIPFEAKRLGLRVFASDLNPVAVIINKALLEHPQIWVEENISSSHKLYFDPREKFAERLEHYGKMLIENARNALGDIYPDIVVDTEDSQANPELESLLGQKLPLIGTLIARTVTSPHPTAMGKDTPLLTTNLLSKKKGGIRIWQPIGSQNPLENLIVTHGDDAPPEGYENPTAKIGRGQYKCLITGLPIKKDHFKEAGQNGNIRTFPFVKIGKVTGGRVYVPIRTSERNQLNAFSGKSLPTELAETLTPPISGYFNPWVYGYKTIGSLFTARQAAVLAEMLCCTANLKDVITSDGYSNQYATSLITYLTMTISRLANRNNAFCTWDVSRDGVTHLFSEQGVKMSWDFVEANPLGESSGSWESTFTYTKKIPSITSLGSQAIVTQADARIAGDPSVTPFVSTDPPYFSSLTYADFSDFYYAIHRETLGQFYPEIFKTMNTPKTEECVSAPHRHGGDRNAAAKHFIDILSQSFNRIHEINDNDIPLTIFYAFKEQDLPTDDSSTPTAWESFLDSLLQQKFMITATMPMRTEYTTTKKKYKNALASSIVLACRHRTGVTKTISRSDFIRELKSVLPPSIKRLQTSAIAPVDLQQASIGPGMAVFSKYDKVIESTGASMTTRTALALINQTLSQFLEDQESELDPWSRFAAIWYEQFGNNSGEFGTAEVLAKAKNVSVQSVVEAGILVSGGSKCRLRKFEELEMEWDPSTDNNLTVWEITHYLCLRFDQGGLESAADLARQVGPIVESARDLAYRLFVISEKNNWTEGAQAYNRLVAAWPDIQHLAAQEPAVTTKKENASLFE